MDPVGWSELRGAVVALGAGVLTGVVLTSCQFISGVSSVTIEGEGGAGGRGTGPGGGPHSGGSASTSQGGSSQGGNGQGGSGQGGSGQGGGVGGWAPQPADALDGQCNGIDFVDSKRGWAVSDQGKIVATTDGGDTWTEQHDAGDFLSDIDFADENNGWAVGSGGTVLKTANGGGLWSPPTTSPTQSTFDWSGVSTQLAGPQVALVGPGGTMVVSMSGGELMWDEYIVVSPDDLYRTDCGATTVFGVGASDSVVYLPGMAGMVTQSSTGEGGPNLALDFVDDDTGWVVGAGGKIAATTNGGTDFTPQTSGVSVTLRGVSFNSNKNDGWAVGDEGTIVHTTNGGRAWTKQNSGTQQRLNDVVFVDTARGWACGENNTILYTESGGL